MNTRFVKAIVGKKNMAIQKIGVILADRIDNGNYSKIHSEFIKAIVMHNLPGNSSNKLYINYIDF